jgi:hypothetical protein
MYYGPEQGEADFCFQKTQGGSGIGQIDSGSLIAAVAVQSVGVWKISPRRGSGGQDSLVFVMY